MPSQLLHPLGNLDKSMIEHWKKQLGTAQMGFQTIPSTRRSNVALYETKSKDLKINKDAKVILHAYGNGDCAENHLYELSHVQRKNPGAIVAGMNFRNVAASGPGNVQTEQDWIDDVIAAVNHYRKKGIPLKNILLHGHSMGGAVMTLAAAQIYQTEIEKLKKPEEELTEAQKLNACPRLFNNRSFANLADEVMVSILGGFGTGLIVALMAVAVAMLLPFAGYTIPPLYIGAVAGGFVTSGLLFPQLPEFFLRPVLNTLLWLGFGRMDAFAAYQSLPEKAKDLIVAKDDGVIKQRATIHYKLKSQRQDIKKELREKIKKETNLSKKYQLIDKLTDLKDCKVQYSESGKKDIQPSVEAHNVPLSMLNTYHKMRGSKAKSSLTQVSGERVLNNKSKKLLSI